MSSVAQRSRGAGLLAVVLAATGFSWGFVIVKAVDLPAPAIAFWRLLLAAAVLSCVAIALRVPWPRQRATVLIAGIAFGAHQLIYIGAVQLTSVAIVTLIGATQPLLVALVSKRTVGERVAPALLLYGALAVVGVGVVMQASAGDQSRDWRGDALAVVNMVVFTAYFLSAKRARLDGAHTVTFTAASQWAALLVVAPALGFVSLRSGADAALPNLEDAGLLLILVLGPANGHLLVNWAHRRVTAALSALVLASTPLLSSIWAALVLDEPLTWRHGVGIGLVVIAIEAARRSEVRRSSAEPETPASGGAASSQP